MANEQQQPMSDARLEEIRQQAGSDFSQMAARELLAEVSRLRAREAALVEVARAVAGGTWAAAVGQGHTPYWTALIHHETNIVEQARALLASGSADEAK